MQRRRRPIRRARRWRLGFQVKVLLAADAQFALRCDAGALPVRAAASPRRMVSGPERKLCRRDRVFDGEDGGQRLILGLHASAPAARPPAFRPAPTPRADGETSPLSGRAARRVASGRNRPSPGTSAAVRIVTTPGRRAPRRYPDASGSRARAAPSPARRAAGWGSGQQIVRVERLAVTWPRALSCGRAWPVRSCGLPLPIFGGRTSPAAIAPLRAGMRRSRDGR